MPPTSKTPQDVIRLLQQMKLALNELADRAAEADDMQLSWWFHTAAIFIRSAELRLIARSTIIAPSPAPMLGSRREPELRSITGPKEGI